MSTANKSRQRDAARWVNEINKRQSEITHHVQETNHHDVLRILDMAMIIASYAVPLLSEFAKDGHFAENRGTPDEIRARNAESIKRWFHPASTFSQAAVEFVDTADGESTRIIHNFNYKALDKRLIECLSMSRPDLPFHPPSNNVCDICFRLPWAEVPMSEKLPRDMVLRLSDLEALERGNASASILRFFCKRHNPRGQCHMLHSPEKVAEINRGLVLFHDTLDYQVVFPPSRADAPRPLQHHFRASDRPPKSRSRARRRYVEY
jgi:hypothetical protein